MKQNVKRIKPPKYKFGRYSLNEYELRNLMLEVAKGDRPHNIQVKDEKGNIATINQDGSLSNTLHGLDIASSFTLKMIKLRREKNQ